MQFEQILAVAQHLT